MLSVQRYSKGSILGILFGSLFLLTFFSPSWVQVLAVGLSLIFCILAFQSLSSLKTAQYTLLWAGMSFGCAAFSVVAHIPLHQVKGLIPIGLGALVGMGITRSVKMIHLPQVMAFFHALVGLATALLTVVLVTYHTQSHETLAFHTAFELSLGGIMAALTFTGSVVAALKLQGWPGFSFKKSPRLEGKRFLIGVSVYVLVFSILSWMGSPFPVTTGMWSHFPIIAQLLMSSAILGLFIGPSVAALKFQGWDDFIKWPLLKDKLALMGVFVYFLLLSSLLFVFPHAWIIGPLLGRAVLLGVLGGLGVYVFKRQGWIDSMKVFLLRDKGVIVAASVYVLVFSALFCLQPTLWIMTVVLVSAAILGAVAVSPIGGADMPVVISLLNSCSGWAALGIGFSLGHPLFIVIGSIVGFSGAVLSYSMCKGMNRSLWDVVWPSAKHHAPCDPLSQRPVQSLSPQDASFLLTSAQRIIVVPGYGMASAQAQHALRDLSDKLKDKGIQVRYAIHPVAGRMPGHMNVLLAEAHIAYEDIFEFDDICADFAQADVALVIGANDIVNTLAKTASQSSIYGMPIFPVDKARTVLFIKRSMAPGYAGLDNPLFYELHTFMVFGDGKKVCEDIAKAV